MIRRTLFLSVVTFGVNAEEVENNEQESHFNQLPIALANPVGVFETHYGWRYSVGLGFELESEYHGSSESEFTVDPYAEFAYRQKNWEFQSSLLNNRLLYQLSDDWYVASWLNFEEGREESEASDNSLDGLGDIDDMYEYGAGISWMATDQLTLSLHGQGYSGGNPEKGYVGFVAAHYRVFETNQWKIDLSADISFADSEHLTTEFGITPEQAENSQYSAYEIDSGIKSMGLGIDGVYALNEQVYVAFTADYEMLASDSADSPLIDIGSENEFEVGITFIFKF